MDSFRVFWQSVREGFYSKDRLSLCVVIDECAPDVAKNVLSILFGPGIVRGWAPHHLLSNRALYICGLNDVACSAQNVPSGCTPPPIANFVGLPRARIHRSKTCDHTTYFS
jgi:hypothetical protein